MAALGCATLDAKPPNPLDRISPVPADQPIPVIDFFRPPRLRSPELSPDGSHFVAIVSTGADRSDALVYDFSAKKGDRLTLGEGNDISDCSWLDDKHFLFHMIKDKRYSWGLCAADINKLSSPKVIERFNVIVPIGVPRENPLQPIIWIRNSAADQGGDGGVVQIDARRALDQFGSSESNASVVNRFPSPAGGEPMGYLSDTSGHLAFAFTARDGLMTLHYFAGSNWAKSPADLEETTVVANGEKPHELFVLGPRQGKKPRALYRMDAVTGKLGEEMYRDPDYDLTSMGLYRRASDGILLGLKYDQKLPKVVWFSERYQAIQAVIEKALPDLVVNILGGDQAEKNFFIEAYSDVMPVRYYHFSLERAELVDVASTAPWIDPKRMRPMQGLNYRTRDGVLLEGYVTLPANVSKEHPVPLVVLPHGGPWVRDRWSWDPQAQYLASRGYAVFQPNYRGSLSYSCRFPEGDDWAFRKMHDDVTDGVKALLGTGFIDRQRVAIMGASFGGYLAMCGAVYEPGLYRCAVTIAGVFDWEKLMKSSKRSEYLRGQYGKLRRELGDPKKDQERFDAITPIRHIDQVKIPIFVAHGGEDVVAPVEQSKALIKELKKYGVPFEKQIEADETHGFHRLDHEVTLYTAVEAFLAKHLAPQAATPSAGMP